MKFLFKFVICSLELLFLKIDFSGYYLYILYIDNSIFLYIAA